MKQPNQNSSGEDGQSLEAQLGSQSEQTASSVVCKHEQTIVFGGVKICANCHVLLGKV